jgi:TP901 family phage tail tape measure protein
MGRGLKVARDRLKKFGRSTGGLVGGALRGAGFGAAVGGLGAMVAMLAVTGAGVIKFEEKLTRLQIQSGRTAGQMVAFKEDVDRVSRATGIARGDVLEAAAGFVSLTGDMDEAQASLETFARVAVASGASMQEISSTAAALKQNMKVRPDEMEKVFSIILAGGKAGAIELKELSSMLAGITPLFSQFGKTGAEGMAELGAMLQLGRQGFGSAGESVTGLQGMMVAFMKNAKKFEKAGVKIFTKDPKTGAKVMRGLADIVRDLGDSKLARDPTRLIKAFGRVEGMRFFNELVKVDGALDDLVETTRNANDVGADYDAFQKSTAGRLKVALNAFKQAVAESFTPERIEAFTKAVVTLFGWLVKLVEKMEEIGGILPGPDQANRDILRGVDAQTKGVDESRIMTRHRGRTSQRILSGVNVEAEKRQALPMSISVPTPLGFQEVQIPGRLRMRDKELNQAEVGVERLGSGRSAPREQRINVTVTPSTMFDAWVEKRRTDHARRNVQ